MKPSSSPQLCWLGGVSCFNPTSLQALPHSDEADEERNRNHRSQESQRCSKSHESHSGQETCDGKPMPEGASKGVIEP